MAYDRFHIFGHVSSTHFCMRCSASFAFLEASVQCLITYIESHRLYSSFVFSQRWIFYFTVVFSV